MNADGSASATSVPTAVVGAATAAPVNTEPPTISGTLTLGQVLTASTGTWSGTAPITFAYVWMQCDANGNACKGVANGSTATFTLVSTDVGNTLRVEVTATNATGARTSTWVPTAVIAAAPATTTTTTTTTTPASTGCTVSGGTVPIADVTSPAHLTIDQFQVTPSTITYATRTLTARFHVSACGGSVQGALLYVTAVPYGMFAIPNEQATGSDGWATLNFTALSGFPVSQHQQLLVMFVRARKSGEPILGGISARRLVSFTVTKG